MAVEFEVQFEKAVGGVRTLQEAVARVSTNIQQSEDKTKEWGKVLDMFLGDARSKFLALADSTSELKGRIRELSQLNAFNSFLEQVQVKSHTASLKQKALSDTTRGLGAIMRETASSDLMSKTLLDISLSVDKTKAEILKLTNAMRDHSNVQTAQASQMKMSLTAFNQMRDSLHKLALDTKVVENNTKNLTSAEAGRLREAQLANEVVRMQVGMETALALQKARVEVESIKLSNSTHRETVTRQEANKVTEQSIREEARLTEQMRQSQSPAAQRIRSLKEQMELSQVQSRESHKLATAIEKEKAATLLLRSGKTELLETMRAENALRSKQITDIAKLASEVKFLSSSEGQAHTKRMSDLEAEKRKLLEATDAQKKKNRELRISNQLTAAWRASLQGLQASIGMYTSSTILMASAMFTVTRTIRETINLGREYTFEMAMAQAVTGETAESFSRVESQVRLLGQTTIFTASQVAKAATELGLAGLNTGQILVALRSTLDLAAIGALEMGRAADHATNIMMIFNKEASDLSDIVDVMATAVTKANTNVDQFANALTYAGPAAETAGFSFEETAAAVATLANQGIKASRSGTALRRLFVNLLNPTAKGKRVMEEYNIQVTNLDGSARSLSDVLGQLNSAFSGLAGPERLAAIQDLVGVYATSSIAALIQANDQFMVMTDHMISATGVAKGMRDVLEQAFEFDVREMKSAFQELQISVFKENEMQLKLWTKGITEFLIGLTEVTEDGSTRLSHYLTRVRKGLMVIVAIFAARKLFQGVQQFYGMSKAVQETYRNLLSQAAAQRAAAIATASGTAATQRSTAAHTAESIAVSNLSNSYKRLALAKAVATGGLGGMLSLAVGTASAVALGIALKDVFSSQEIFEGMNRHESKVMDIRDRYLEVKAAIDATNLDKEKAAMEAQLKASAKYGKELKEELEAVEKSIKEIESGGEDGFLSEADYNMLSLLERRKRGLDDLIKKQEDEYKALEATTEVGVKRIDDQKKLTGEIAKTEEQLRKAELAVQQTAEAMSYATSSKRLREIRERDHLDAIAKMGELSQLLEGLRAQITLLSKPLDVDQIFADWHKGLAEAVKGNEELETSSEAAMEAAKEGMIGAQEELSRLTSLIGQAKVSQEQLGSAIQRTMAGYTNFVAAWVKAKKERDDVLEQAAGFKEDIRRSGLTEDQRRVEDKQKILELDQKIRESEAAGIPDAKEYTALLKERAGIKITEAKARGGAKPGRNRDLEEAIRTYETLYQKADKIGHAHAQHAKSLDQLKLALASGAISQEQYGKALKQLNDDTWEAVRSFDELGKSIWDLQAKYAGGSITGYIDDMNKLTEAFNKGAVSAEKFKRVQEQILAKLEKDTLESGLSGRVGINLTQSSGPFEEMLKMGIDTANSNKNWEKQREAEKAALEVRSEMIQAQYDLDRERALDRFKQGLDDKAEHDARMLAAEKKYLDDTQTVKKAAEVQNQAFLRETMDREKEHRTLMMASVMGSFSDLLGQFASIEEDASSAQKAAFLAQKALAVAEIIMYTEVAAARVQAETGLFDMGTMAQWVRAQGYASAGLVAALSIGQYSGAYDQGGYIPTGKYGIVGEYGPEIVNGPAFVTGREATARKLGGGETYQTIAPVINIEYKTEGGESPADQQKSANLLAGTIEAVVIKTLTRELRPNGMLNRS